MEARMSILFYGKKTALDSSKKLWIYLRVTINGERFEVSTQHYVEPAKWSISAGKVKGSSEEARSTNTLTAFCKRCMTIKKSVDMKERVSLKKHWGWNGTALSNMPTLVQVFRQHNDQLQSLIGKDNSKATYNKYRTTLDHTISFLQWKFKRSDIEISSINYSFITDLSSVLVLLQHYISSLQQKTLPGLRM